MKIPKNLPQFEKQPALFVASGEYEAKFYLALNGILDLKAEIKMPPRQEAREKQAFIGIKGEKRGLASVSHQGAYLEDLKKKFSEETSILVNDLENLNDQELDKVLQTYRYNPWILKDCFYRYIMLGNFTKANSIIEMINNEFPEINEAFQYQLDLMTFILEKLEMNEESK